MSVPVYSPTKKRLGSIPVEIAATMPKEQVVRTRRGHIVCVIQKALTCHVRPVLTRAGQTEQRTFAGQPVWCMRGTNGQVV